MADGFINIPFDTDSRTYSDEAIQRLKDQWPGWEPSEGDQEVIMLETVSPMAADVAQAAVRVHPAVFRTFGTKLVGTPYEQGSPATTTLTFTFTDALGHVVPAATEVEVGGWAFQTDTEASAPAGTTTIAITATATVNGAGGNNLGPGATMITSLAYVASVTATTTANGTDAEDDLGYQDRLTAELQLSAKTLVTGRDYELYGSTQPGVGRILAFADPANRTVRVVATDLNGDLVASGIKTTLLDSYNELRLSNWVVSVDDPTYTTISVTYAVHPYPGHEGDDLIARTDAVLEAWLQPSAWGRPKNFGDPGSAFGFAIQPRVRVNKLIDLIGDVDGVDYVDTLIITAPGATPESNGDVTMPGDVPLTRPGFMAGTVV
jgi:hypothetical protein